MIHICPFCNEPFEGRKNMKFCRRSHSSAYVRWLAGKPRKVEPNMTGACLNCGAPVPPGQRYCCDLCGKQWRYENKYAAPDYEKAKREPKQLPMIAAARPLSGPRCSCGVVLYGYERGKCLRCARASIIQHRTDVNAVRATLAASRQGGLNERIS